MEYREVEVTTIREGFKATCNICGERIEVAVSGPGYFQQLENGYEWRVPLDRTEVEAHLLMHSLCTCAYTVETENEQITGGGRISTEIECPIHGRTA